MADGLDSHLLLRALVDELRRCGVAHAVTSPGSRSTPIVAALAQNGRLTCHPVIDERAAGFHALGLAKATGAPVVLACTSGTATAEYLPAVVEAHEAGVPLVVLTADRPPELREVGAGQAIDQLHLYGRNVRWFFDLGTHEATPARTRWVRSLGCRLVHAAEGLTTARPGPVHLNAALREPLVLDRPLPPDPQPGRGGDRRWLEASGAGAIAVGTLPRADRIVVVAGRAERHHYELPRLVRTYAEVTGAVLLADPLSNTRGGPAAIAHYDALLRHAPFAAAHVPDLVVRVGDLPTSKPLRTWLRDLPTDVVQLGLPAESSWPDPDATLHALVAGDPAGALHSAAFESLHARGLDLDDDGAVPGGDPGWRAAWRAADVAAASAIEAELAAQATLTEPAVARTLAAALPPGHTLVVASSMPIRDLETFAAARDDGPRVLSNRGANGIDGTLATALGVAAAGTPTTVLLGDVAFAYDHGALLSLRRLGLELNVVVIDNGGGGIFDFLPAARLPAEIYEPHVATPPGLDLPAAAGLYGLEPVEARTREELEQALRPGVMAIVRTDRAANVEHHRAIWAAVADRLGSDPL